LPGCVGGQHENSSVMFPSTPQLWRCEDGSPQRLDPDDIVTDVLRNVRLNHFMNKSRHLGFIEYNDRLEVHSSLLSVVQERAKHREAVAVTSPLAVRRPKRELPHCHINLTAASTFASELPTRQRADLEIFFNCELFGSGWAPAQCERSIVKTTQSQQMEIRMTPDSKKLEANKAITARFTEQFKNKHIVDSVDELFSPRASLHLPLGEQAVGPDGQKEIGRTIFAAIPDVHVTIDNVMADGNFVAERHTARGTHKGEFLGVAATGKKIHWTENHLYRVEDGLIQEVWSEWSYQNLLAQLSK
jgi:predicted ester cyclase